MALDNLMGGALWISIAGMGFSVILSLYNLWLNYKQSKVADQMERLISEVEMIRLEVQAHDKK